MHTKHKLARFRESIILACCASREQFLYTHSSAAFWLEHSGLRERGKGPQEWWYSSHPPTCNFRTTSPYLLRHLPPCLPWHPHLLGSVLLLLRRLSPLPLPPDAPLTATPRLRRRFLRFLPRERCRACGFQTAAAVSRKSTWGASVAAASAAALSWAIRALLLSLHWLPLRCLQGCLQVLLHSLRPRTSILWQQF